MALSVEAVLHLEVFSRTRWRVYAGHANLDRSVRWVHPVEVPDIARFLSGGEMLLTAGLGIGRSGELQRRYIKEIADAGASVLVVELSGRVFSAMPAALVEEADKHGLPLVGLQGELPFVEISAQVHEFLTDHRVAELAAFERLNAQYIRMLLDNSDPGAFTESLAHQVGHPVVLEDANHDVVAYAGGTSEADEVLTNWGLHARVMHRPDTALTPVARSAAVESPGCARRAIVLRGERWGWLHILHGSERLTNIPAYALDRAADAIAIALLGVREAGVQAGHRQSSIVNRLLLGDITGEQFVDRALRLGRDLRNRPLVVVFHGKQSADDAACVSYLDSVYRSLHVPAVMADVGEHVLAVVGMSARCSDRQLVEHFERRGLRAGVSRTCTAAQLPEAIRQARTAAAAAASRETATVLTFDGLGVLRLLASLSQGPELSRYVEDELGALLAHDASTANPLLPTLRAYLACDGNKSQAAEKLFVQRRTLYYRLERLEGLLGKSLEDPETRQGLALAVRALDFLGAQEDHAVRSRPVAG
ncbi:PucR family transcriptional regulator ligand-binding domain-containing protein [Thermocrispum sp.]|uniref:PucR family transcriptional regulator n=1 Tax=Thermocrispum sp. TaxID=2060768 RepID=UPI00257DABFB|nr:PucR family transcriptional regulator ligand-binding domain-containing protein [Thermocrispum sp.]